MVGRTTPPLCGCRPLFAGLKGPERRGRVMPGQNPGLLLEKVKLWILVLKTWQLGVGIILSEKTSTEDVLLFKDAIKQNKFRLHWTPNP